MLPLPERPSSPFMNEPPPQVLDGVPIEAAEQAAAKSKHSGRLTRDFLEERLGHTMFDQIRDMDCSSLKVDPVAPVDLADPGRRHACKPLTSSHTNHTFSVISFCPST